MQCTFECKLLGVLISIDFVVSIFSHDQVQEEDPYLRLDKFLHIGACFFIVVVLFIVDKVFVKVAYPEKIALIVGVIKEVWDGPRMSLRDLNADVLGIILAQALKGASVTRKREYQEVEIV